MDNGSGQVLRVGTLGAHCTVEGRLNETVPKIAKLKAIPASQKERVEERTLREAVTLVWATAVPK